MPRPPRPHAAPPEAAHVRPRRTAHAPFGGQAACGLSRTRTCAGPPGGTCAARNMTELCSDARELMRTPTSKPPAAAGSSTPLRPVAERITGATHWGEWCCPRRSAARTSPCASPRPQGRRSMTYGELGERSRELALGLDRARHRGWRGRVDPVLDEGRVDTVRDGRRVRGRGGGADLSHELARGVQARAGRLRARARVLRERRAGGEDRAGKR